MMTAPVMEGLKSILKSNLLGLLKLGISIKMNIL